MHAGVEVHLGAQTSGFFCFKWIPLHWLSLLNSASMVHSLFGAGCWGASGGWGGQVVSRPPQHIYGPGRDGRSWCGVPAGHTCEWGENHVNTVNVNDSKGCWVGMRKVTRMMVSLGVVQVWECVKMGWETSMEKMPELPSLPCCSWRQSCSNKALWEGVLESSMYQILVILVVARIARDRPWTIKLAA